MHVNQVIASIEIKRHGDRDFPFGSQKSGNETSVDFGRNADDKIGMNPSRTIGIPRPQITRTSQGSFNVFNSIKGESDLADRGLSWHGGAKSESENLKGNKFFKNYERKNIFEVEKVGRESSVFWNNKDSESICADPNHTKSNQAIPADSTNIRSIHDSANIH